VTKAGTNRLHGSAYYYERNQALAVTNPFNTLGDLPLENVQWGASLGGPFWKDHTFWFTNFEKQKFTIATGNSGLEPNQYYQAAALQLLNDAGVPVNPATQKLLSILWPADLLAGTTPGFFQSAAPEYGYRGRATRRPRWERRTLTPTSSKSVPFTFTTTLPATTG
jgi:hypothetical protein